MKLSKLILIVLTLSTLTGCAPFDSHYNKFEKTVLETQKELLVNENIIEDSFYHDSNIRLDQSYRMSDDLYLVYYYKTGESLEEGKFEEIVTEYRKEKSSIPVYVSEDQSGDIRLEFIIRDKNVYTLEDIWYSADNVTQLPYKIEKQ